jgi:hypothetical protein
METNNKFQDYISKPEVNFFLSILIPLMALAVTWGIFTARLDHVEKMVNGLQETYSQQQRTNEEIKVTLAEIKANQLASQKDILYIRQGLDRHVNQ